MKSQITGGVKGRGKTWGINWDKRGNTWGINEEETGDRVNKLGTARA